MIGNISFGEEKRDFLPAKDYVTLAPCDFWQTGREWGIPDKDIKGLIKHYFKKRTLK